jgi:hypothetical protein
MTNQAPSVLKGGKVDSAVDVPDPFDETLGG